MDIIIAVIIAVAELVILYFIIKWAVAAGIEMTLPPVTQPEPKKECPHCGQGCPVDSQYCVGCGKRLPDDRAAFISCPHCRRETPAGVSYCAYCGEKLP